MPIRYLELLNLFRERFHLTDQFPDGSQKRKVPPINVLVVEDYPINQKIITLQLNRLGLEPAIANNGMEAIEYLDNHTPDVILMDIQMPVLNGLDATQEIRKKHTAKDMPIIALTANALSGDKKKYLEAGMNDYIPKPVDFEQLQSKLLYWAKKIVEGKKPIS